ncbi:RagB/SusD family nutrient uptake outer membrane protein [Rufibacter immobilis]|uniref:RagB/SusD family nutrient uptake outer membrane protein n=1 Tax=Rufibacter immobilis TaxID=1348778 RepID=A0A3M9MRZ4_9BACT|nr:RagB/SusD family nutrient uptake outer membrane protein [Rufibacter immobilis]RNI28286.1 RagB/SusD family nutrient uptake outer membrane protein [Rufibacter immobilis]
MKRNIYKAYALALFLGGSVTVSSCEDYLEIENPSTLAQTTVFSSTTYAEGAIAGVYNQLSGDNGYGSRISTLFPNAADDFIVTGDWNAEQRTGIAHFEVSPKYPDLEGPFLQLYRGIERANICIKYIPASDLYTSGTAAEQALMRKLHGEALTLRAQFYHELIRNWGDVPAHFEPSADVKDLYLPKTNQDEIYDKLLEDLRIASELVPWQSESGDPTTRVTKAAVKALRARIALARGGYALRRESRRMERLPDYQGYYTIARNETADIIQRKENGLNPKYENVFRSLHGNGVSDVTKEHIWQVGAFGGNSRTDTKLGFGNGPRIDGASKYGRANGLTTAVPTYFYAFDSIGDSRRDVTLAYLQVDGTDNKVLTTPLQMREGKFRKYWTAISGANQTLGINWPLIRYADVLLMFAEAENELSGPTAQAIAAFEEVRKRAYFDAYETEARMGVTPTDKTGFFRAIVNERYLEFGGEGIRKYDLIRWNLLEAKILETREKMTAMMNGTGRYANVPAVIYYKTNALLGSSVTAQQEAANFDLFGGTASTDQYGGSIAQVMYTKEPATAPAGYRSLNWRKAVTAAQITGPNSGFASHFKPNHSEVFPIFSGVISQNYRLSQDYGY